MLTIAQDERITPIELAALFSSSGIHRPVGDHARLAKMLEHANLSVSARDGLVLVGVALALTDFSWVCFVRDLAVARDYQRQGIGRRILDKVGAIAGEQTSLCLNAGPGAETYYGHIGFVPIESAWRIPRKR